MIRKKMPDKKNALSIVESAKRDMDYTLTIPVNENSAPTIVRNIYENFRMLGDAILISKGIKSTDHIQQIKELLKIKINTERPLGLIDNLRISRHRINYYGYRPRTDEAKEAVDLARNCFYPLLKEILKMIS